VVAVVEALGEAVVEVVAVQVVVDPGGRMRVVPEPVKKSDSRYCNISAVFGLAFTEFCDFRTKRLGSDQR